MPANLLVKWIKSLGKKMLGHESRRSRRSRAGAMTRRIQPRCQPSFELLEDRVVPTIWVVNTTADSSSPTIGMLRYAIDNAVNGDTITFAPSLSGQTISLTGTLTITDNITIVASPPSVSTGSLVLYGTGNGGSPVIIVNSGVTASISGLSIENGLSSTGAGIRNLGTLALSYDTITGNGSLNNTGTNNGAGIYSSGIMDINDCTISNNTSFWNGGGIMNTGTMTVTNSTISGNNAYTYGGGIYNTGNLTLANDTISGNAGWAGNSYFPEAGGGIASFGNLSMANILVSGNVTSGSGPDIYGNIANISNSLIGTTSGYTTSGGANNQMGTAASLSSLADNGGPTQTLALSAGSAGIAGGGAVTTVGGSGIAATGNTVTLTTGGGAYIGNVSSGLAIPIEIDTEQMLVTGVSGDTLTVIRGYNGTTEAAHSAGADVYFLLDQRGYSIDPTTVTPDIGSYQTVGATPSAPTVTGVSPASGTAGATVTITGTNLQNATSVDFGAVPGSIVSDSGTVIVATAPAEPDGLVDITVTTVGWNTSATSTADQFLFTSYNDSLVDGALSIDQVSSENADLSLSLSGGNYTLTDSGGLLFAFPTGDDASSISGGGTNSLTIPSSAVTSISVLLGAGTNFFDLTGTDAPAAPITVNAGTTAGDQVDITGAVVDSGAVALTANVIVESGSGSLSTTGTLTTSSITGTFLSTTSNAIGTFNASESGVGFVVLLDSNSTLKINGITDTTTGSEIIVANYAGGVSVTGAISAGSNSVNLTASTSITQPAGLFISAGAVSLTAGSIGTAGQSLDFNATSVSTDTSSSNGSQFLADSATVGLSIANALNAGTGTVTLTGGTFQTLVAGVIPNTSILTVNSPAILDLDGNNESIGALAGSGTITDSGAAATLTITGGGLFSGAITGANLGLTVASTSQPLTLSGTPGSNTYAGATTIQSGTLKLGASNTLPSTTTVIFGSAATNGTLDLNGFNQTVAGLSIAAPNTSDPSQLIGDSSTVAGSTLTVTGTSTFGGIIEDHLGTGTQDVALDVDAPGGTVTLGGANTYSGGTNIIGGTLQLGSSSALPASSSITFGSASSNGVLDLNGFSPTISGLAVASGATAASQAIGNSSTTSPSTLTIDSGTSTFGGAIVNAIGSGTQTTGLTLSGGSLDLTGLNTYTGATDVNAGQLLVDGTITASAIAVTGSGVLGGKGTVGAITANGGTVDPGDPVSSPAILTATSANFSFADLTLGVSALTTPGSGYDQLNLGSGALTLGSSSVLTLNVAGLNNTGTIDNLIAYGSHTGVFASVNLINNPNNLQAVLNYTATDLIVTIVGPATHFQVTGLSGTVVAGTPLTVTVTALDAFNHVSPFYTGTINFSTSDPSIQAVLPTSYTFTAGDSGVHTFTGLTQLVTVGTETVTATDPSDTSITGTSGLVTITPAAADQLVVSTQPSATATAGIAFGTQPVVKEEDTYGNVITSDSVHTVTVARGSLGTGSLLGSPLTVTLSSGVATFSGLYYDVVQTMNLGFSTNAGAFTATSNSIAVNPAAPTVATAAAANPTTVTSATTALSVLGASIDTSASTLTYTWAAIGTSPAGVTFSANGTNAAQNTTATFATGGNYEFQVTITDTYGLTTTSTVDVTVAQTLTSISLNPSTVNIDASETQIFLATGFDQFGVPLASQPTFTWATNVGSINSSGNFTAENVSGTGIVTATVGSVVGSAAVTITGVPPAITSSNGATFVVGTSGSFSATASGFPAPTFVESGSLPSGVTFTSAGVLSGMPAAGTSGIYPITIIAENGVSPDAIQSFTLTVDQAPAITSSTATTFTAGSSGSFAVTATGYPTSTFTESGPLPSGVTLTAAGVLTGTPAVGTGGTYPITLTATNGISPNATQSFTLTVDQAPVITSANTTTFTVGASGSLAVTASGYPAPTFTEIGSLPSGVTLTSAGVLSGTPVAGTGGSYSIVLEASNGVSPDASQTFTLTVDQAPAITSATATTFAAGKSGSFAVTATGYPAESFSETGPLPTGVTLTAAGVLSGTPAAGTGGTYPITITATNGISPDATQSFTLTVDQAPAITSANTTTFTVGASGSLAVTASGYPAPTFTEIGALPSGVTLTSAGVLSGTPAAGTGGSYAIVIEATNGTPPDASQAFTLTVDQAPAITSSASTGFSIGSSGSFAVTASGYPAATLSETGVLPSGVTLTAAGVLSGTPAAGTAGTYPITITAANGIAPAATQSFTLTIGQAPSLSNSFVTVSPGSVAAGATTTITLQAVDTYGNDLTVGGLHVVFALGSGTGQGTITAATDNGNGTYTATFTGQIAGSNTITATIGGQPVTSAAPTLTVTPGTISITHSQVSTALPSVQLGGETTVVLQGEDSYGNLETTGGATNIAFELENSTGGHGTISSVKDNGNGTYTAIFIGTVDGPNTIEATIGGSPVTSTTPVSVTGAAVNLADSLLSVAAATVQSGSGIQVSLQAESAKGVKETSGGLIVAFGLGSGSGGQGTFGPVSYLGNGVYTATFTGTLAGKNTIIATIDGLKVTSKAPAISVLPGTLSYSNSLVTVSSASVSAGGTTTTITFQPRDAAGNKLTLKGLPVSFALGGNGTAQGTFSNGGVAVYKNGVYTATFKGTLVGGSTIVTTVNSEAIASNPPVISVTPGTALAANSKLTISEGADTVSSGGSITLMVQAVDANGNLETTGGLKVSFKLASKTGGLGTFGKVTDNKNGTYTVTFTGTTAGTNTIEATIGGKTVSSTVTITVT